MTPFLPVDNLWITCGNSLFSPWLSTSYPQSFHRLIFEVLDNKPLHVVHLSCNSAAGLATSRACDCY